MKILLHIGWHKTGTSSLQKFLFSNKNILFEHFGILYPETGCIESAHHKAAWSLQEPLQSRWAKKIKFAEKADEFFPKILNEAVSKNSDTVILSSEEFSDISKYKTEKLAAVLKDHDVKIICYVRRQDFYLESLYSQLLKTSFMRYKIGFETFVSNKMKDGGLDYMKYFNSWSESFPKENMIIRTYERNILESSDIRADFLNQIGIDGQHLFDFSDKEQNISLGFKSVEFLKRMNHIPLSEKQHELVVNELQKMEATQPFEKSLLNYDQRKNIIEFYNESNNNFALHYLSSGNPFVIQDTEKDHPNPVYIERDFIDMLSVIMPKLLNSKS